MQWYDHLRRPRLSIYSKIYAWARQGDDECANGDVPQAALDELALGVIFGVYWRVDLTRDFHPLASASDASTDFGFGVSVCTFLADLLHAVARWSEKQGAYVVLDGDPAEASRVDRMGDCSQLNLRHADFKDVLCVR